MVYTKVMSNKSPWLAQAEVGKIYTNPASHGEGRFVANEEWLQKLFANGQVATCYVNELAIRRWTEEWNVEWFLHWLSEVLQVRTEGSR